MGMLVSCAETKATARNSVVITPAIATGLFFTINMKIAKLLSQAGVYHLTMPSRDSKYKVHPRGAVILGSKNEPRIRRQLW